MIKAGYKQTEVGVIPEDWELSPLKLISPKQSVGLVINPSSYFDDNGTVPMLVGSNIKENCINWELAKRITNDSNKLIPSSRLAAGDLVTVRVGEPGLTAVVPPELDGCNCASVMIVRQHHSFDSNWLCYVMNSKNGLAQVEHVQYGTAQKQFNISDAINFSYPLPPTKAEQTAIAKALSDTDALIQSLSQLMAKKRQIKQGAMQTLLNPYDETGVLKAGWVVKKLGEISNIYTGNKNNQDKIENGLYPFFVRSKYIKRINSYSFDGEAILIPGEGNIGNIFHYINGKFDFHQRVYKISDFKEKYSGKYIYRYISENFGSHAMKNSVKATVDSLRLPTFEVFEIPFPPTYEEQTQIAQTLTDMDTEITALETKLSKYQKIKQGVM